MKLSKNDGSRREAADPTPGGLFLAFLGIGLSGFGGVLPWARRALVETRGWLTAEAFNETLALCQSLPGPNIVNLSVVVGGRFAGASGALAAVTGLVAAPVAIVIVLAMLYQRFGAMGRAPEAIAALGAAAAGLVAATAAKMASNYPPPIRVRNQAVTMPRMVWNLLAPGFRRAVSTTVRISASPWAAHMAR